jgi:hypothetical protein
MDSVIYEDSPYSNARQKGAPAIALFPVVIVILFCLFNGNITGVIGGFAAGLLIGCYHWALFPRKYQIFDNKLRIVLGWRFPFDIPFDNLEIAREPARTEWLWGTSLGFGIYSREHTVQIVQKGRALKYVNISPSDREKFLGHLNKAMDERKSNKSEENLRRTR